MSCCFHCSLYYYIIQASEQLDSEKKKSWSKSHFILGKLRVGVTSTAALQQSRAGPGRAGPGRAGLVAV